MCYPEQGRTAYPILSADIDAHTASQRCTPMTHGMSIASDISELNYMLVDNHWSRLQAWRDPARGVSPAREQQERE